MRSQHELIEKNESQTKSYGNSPFSESSIYLKIFFVQIDKASTSAETVYVVPRVTRTFLDFDYGKNEEEDEDYDPEKVSVTKNNIISSLNR